MPAVSHSATECLGTELIKIQHVTIGVPLEAFINRSVINLWIKSLGILLTVT